MHRRSFRVSSPQGQRPLDPQHIAHVFQACNDAMHACDWGKLNKNLPAFREYFRLGVRPTPFLVSALFDDAIRQKKAVDNQTPLRAKPVSTYRHEKIRIGYLSADFGDHATAYLILKTLADHDKTTFTVYLYDYSALPESDTRRRILDAADVYRPLRDLSDEAAAALMRQDEIDILIDMKGQVFGGRPEILRHQPAPHIVNYLAYPGTNGPSTDYVITDRETFGDAPHFFEKPLVLPHFYLPYSGICKRPSPEAVADFKRIHGLEDCPLILGCLNASYKITEGMLGVWRECLQRHPEARFLLLANSPQVADNLRRAFGSLAERTLCLGKATVDEHLVRLAALDLFCDSFPVCAHTVALDAAYVGTPVLTRSGETYITRVAASANRWMGIVELNTNSLEAYRTRLFALCESKGERDALRLRVAAQAPELLRQSVAKGLEEIFRSLVALNAAAST